MHMASSPWAKPRVLGCGQRQSLQLFVLSAFQALPDPAEPGVESRTANTPLSKGNLNVPVTGIVQQPLLLLLLPQKFTNDVTDGSGSQESISALLQFVLS